MLVFEEIREPEGEKPLGAINEDKQQQTKSTYGVAGRWRPIRTIVLRSELFRPQSGQPSDEESNEGLF